jgi:glycosyltransferase involved in cell wall biosynthesis
MEGRHSRRRGSGYMAGGDFKVLILAGQLRWHDRGWPLSPLLDRLQRRGCHVQVLCLSKGSELVNDPRALELPKLENRWLRNFVFRGLWSYDQLIRPDLIHSVHDEMSDIALDLSETARLPYVQTVSRFGTVMRGVRLSRRWCRRLVATSPDLAQELIEQLGIPHERLAVIPPGIAPILPPSRKARDGKVPVIGTGGALEEASGILVFLEAARRIMAAGYDVEFVIASQGAQQTGIRHRTQRLQIAERVTVTDYPSVGADFWPVLDVYCQPAVVASAGRTLIQALGHAIPSIATDVKGLRALIGPGENGMIVPRGDPAALEKAIITLLDQPEEARRMGAHALDRARVQFDPDVEAERLIDLYRQAAGPSAHSSGPFLAS